jgi:lysophospholipase L1-like esterase
VLTAAWAAAGLVPIVILGHVEFKAVGGAAGGWSFASLSPEEPLFAWTRNRLVLFAALYALGWILLLAAGRRDPAGARLGAFARSPASFGAAGVAVAVVITALAAVESAAVPLIAMAMGVGFFALWCAMPSGEALAGLVGRLALLAATLLALGWAAEWVMRRPAIVARTGGSAEQRAALREAAHDPSELRHPLGWRTRRHPGPTPPGARRIFVLGDSFSYGDFVPDLDDVWPFVLEDALVAAGRRVEVINSGTAGSDTVYQHRLLETTGWGFAPDVVIVQYTLNDAGPPAHRGTSPLVPMLGRSLARRSALYQFLDNHFRSRQVTREHRDWWPRTFAPDAPGWKASRAALNAIGREARERGVSALLLLFPMFDSDLSEEAYWNLAAHAAVRDAAREAGLDFIDLRPRLAAVDPDPRRWWARPFDSHPGPDAHHVAGEAVARRLLETGALDAAL